MTAWTGGWVTDRSRCVLAANPGPMTLEGTNTWLLAEPGHRGVVVVDPGPDDETHLRAVLAAARERDQQVELVLLTHGHPDHAAGARRLADLARSPVRAVDPRHRLGGEGLTDGEVVAAAGLELAVVRTPGHTSDSLCLHLPADGAVLTGDTVLGRGTSVVAHPDGQLTPYLASLRALRDLAVERGLRRLLPGHGPVLGDPAAVLEGYLTHREQRLGQVRRALAAGAGSAREVVEQVYADVDPALWDAAELSVRAQLEHLAQADDAAAAGTDERPTGRQPR